MRAAAGGCAAEDGAMTRAVVILRHGAFLDSGRNSRSRLTGRLDSVG